MDTPRLQCTGYSLVVRVCHSTALSGCCSFHTLTVPHPHCTTPPLRNTLAALQPRLHTLRCNTFSLSTIHCATHRNTSHDPAAHTTLGVTPHKTSMSTFLTLRYPLFYTSLLHQTLHQRHSTAPFPAHATTLHTTHRTAH